jgi:hypothetical protein
MVPVPSVAREYESRIDIYSRDPDGLISTAEGI